MKCKHCESENIQIVSNYVELKEKDVPTAYRLMVIFSAILLFIGIILLGITGADVKSDDSSRTIGYIISFIVLFSGINMALIAGVIKALLPYKHKTEITAICLDCGQSWVIKEIDLNN